MVCLACVWNSRNKKILLHNNKISIEKSKSIIITQTLIIKGINHFDPLITLRVCLTS
jgi:hypothetical protein